MTWGRGGGLPVVPAQHTGARPKERTTGNRGRNDPGVSTTGQDVSSDHWGQYQAPGSRMTWGQETGPAGLRQWGQCEAPASSMTWQVGRGAGVKKGSPPELSYPSYRREPPWPAPEVVRLSPQPVPLVTQSPGGVQRPEVVRLSWGATPSWPQTTTPVPYVPQGVSSHAPHYSPSPVQLQARELARRQRWEAAYPAEGPRPSFRVVAQSGMGLTMQGPRPKVKGRATMPK